MEQVSAKLKNRLGSEWMVLLISLLLAFSMWFIHELTQKYTVTMKFKVTVETDLAGHAGVSTSDDVLVLRGTGTGAKIIGMRRSANKAGSLLLKVDGGKLHPLKSDPAVFELQTRDIESELETYFDSKITISSIETEKLLFRLNARNYKMVPVALSEDIQCKSQYMVNGTPLVEPDSVAVYGESTVLENISRVTTEKLSFYNADAPLDGTVRLKQIKDVEMSQEEVAYHVEVVRFVELTAQVRYQLKGAPAGVHVTLLPSSASLKYRVPYSLAGEDNTGSVPEFVVDYKDFQASRTGMVVPRMVNPRIPVISYELDPPDVECVLK
ncbi:MAG: hypothetical protein KBT44_01035 [Bacteroidales bacterium]|nr:hypothetical protein [Candidatus Equibacterium intestinale]